MSTHRYESQFDNTNKPRTQSPLGAFLDSITVPAIVVILLVLGVLALFSNGV